ncbi:B3 domain-containing protein Os06g0107800-like [Hordeum vulgare subsp. vulgare]|uniref:TF-B3 domain-containing protein n=1 Tax=Hordeum vulgare subsp. vulgare TaxID=112509 RepID=A0A8I6Y7G4_HORVV|nr:B3 domain-containing protein Os06g0107800-like [Hordeum vulgare subsp. vulgare]
MALTAGGGESRGAEQDGGGGGVELSRSSGNGGNGEERRMRREHMFDKVVTPSDVGKLNRLVVPKHFAERHILPRLLGGAARAACPGAVLRFEDGRGGGRAWAFRFSYWSSSQSYVMTKGWSAFVRDRRLAAGDTVSFCRTGARLFIDCRRRGTGIGASAPPTRLLAPAVMPQVVTLMPQRSTSSGETAPHVRCFRLFGVDLELIGAEPLSLDLQLALMRR